MKLFFKISLVLIIIFLTILFVQILLNKGDKSKDKIIEDEKTLIKPFNRKKFVQLYNDSIFFISDNNLMKYHLIDDTVYQIYTLKDSESVLVGHDFYVVYNLDLITANIYSYFKGFNVYDFSNKQIYSFDGLFSVIFVENDDIYVIKYNEISNFDQNISSVQKLSFNENEFICDMIFELPLEVDRKYQEVNAFSAVSYRIPTVYLINDDGSFNSFEYEYDFGFLKNKYCLITQENSFNINCENNLEISFDGVTHYYISEDRIYIAKVSNSENVVINTISSLENIIIKTIELPYEFPSYEFKCFKDYCVFYTNDDFVLIYI